MLNEVYWNLVDRHGFEPNWYDSASSKGNIVALNLVLGAMMLQPCNPTFFAARDAIVQADLNYYGGAHLCDIWTGFAKRGFGVDASSSTYENRYSVGDFCKKSRSKL
jgi:hypothetical protein